MKSSMKRAPLGGFVVFSLLLLLAPPAVRAQDNNNGITVSGSGQVKGKPTLVEISAQISGKPKDRAWV